MTHSTTWLLVSPPSMSSMNSRANRTGLPIFTRDGFDRIAARWGGIDMAAVEVPSALSRSANSRERGGGESSISMQTACLFFGHADVVVGLEQCLSSCYLTKT